MSKRRSSSSSRSRSRDAALHSQSSSSLRSTRSLRRQSSSAGTALKKPSQPTVENDRVVVSRSSTSEIGSTFSPKRRGCTTSRRRSVGSGGSGSSTSRRPPRPSVDRIPETPKKDQGDDNEENTDASMISIDIITPSGFPTSPGILRRSYSSDGGDSVCSFRSLTSPRRGSSGISSTSRSSKRLEELRNLSQWQKKNRESSSSSSMTSPSQHSTSSTEGIDNDSLRIKLEKANHAIGKQKVQIQRLMEEKQKQEIQIDVLMKHNVEIIEKQRNEIRMLKQEKEEWKSQMETIPLGPSPEVPCCINPEVKDESQPIIMTREILRQSNVEKDEQILNLQARVRQLQIDLAKSFENQAEQRQQLHFSSRNDSRPLQHKHLPTASRHQQSRRNSTSCCITPPSSESSSSSSHLTASYHGEDQATLLKTAMDAKNSRRRRSSSLWRIGKSIMVTVAKEPNEEHVDSCGAPLSKPQSIPPPSSSNPDQAAADSKMLQRLKAENEMLWRQLYDQQKQTNSSSSMSPSSLTSSSLHTHTSNIQMEQ